MNITREQRDGGISVLKVVVGEADYGKAVENQLREYKRKAQIPGFRPGMVPMGIVKKMYGKHVLAEQSYHIASNSVFEYLQKENIDYVGDVIPLRSRASSTLRTAPSSSLCLRLVRLPRSTSTSPLRTRLSTTRSR